MSINRVENRSICAECGGECCKGGGCAYLSTDFEALKTEVVEQALATGRVSIAASLIFEFTKNGVPSYSPILYLRARNIGRGEIDLVSIPKQCASLEEHGCHFDLEHRPSDGACIIPDANKKCGSVITRSELVESWIPYQGILRRIVKRHVGKPVEAQIKEDAELFIYDLIVPTGDSARTIYQMSHKETLKSFRIVFPEEYRKAQNRVKAEIGITRFRSVK